MKSVGRILHTGRGGRFHSTLGVLLAWKYLVLGICRYCSIFGNSYLSSSSLITLCIFRPVSPHICGWTCPSSFWGDVLTTFLINWANVNDNLNPAVPYL